MKHENFGEKWSASGFFSKLYGYCNFHAECIDLIPMVLCLEDDPVVSTLVVEALGGMEVHLATRVEDAKKLIEANDYDAYLLDIQLPDGDGLRFAEMVAREKGGGGRPVFIISGQKQLSNKVAAFTFGVDDFLEKPFDPIELKARLESRIQKNRHLLQQNEEIVAGDIVIDLSRQTAFLVSGHSRKNLNLTTLELKILTMLCRRPEMVFSREMLLDRIWMGTNITDRTVDSHISHLRKKLAGSRLSVDTLKGIGYRMTINP